MGKIFKEKNPTILCDVDGVLADFVGDILKKSGSILKPENINTWDMFALMKIDVKKKADELLKTPEFWRHLTILPHAQKEVVKLRHRGKVLFVTSPWYLCKEWVHERRMWLKRNFDADDKEIIFCQDKSHVRGDIFIDDRCDNIINWQKTNPDKESRIMDRTYNLNLKWAPRVRIGEHGWEYYDGTWEMLDG